MAEFFSGSCAFPKKEAERYILNYKGRIENHFRLIIRTTEEEDFITRPQKKWETPEQKKIKERSLEATSRKDFLTGMTDEDLEKLIAENGDVLI